LCRGAGGRGRGRQTSQSALAASVASRYALGADGVGAAHPGACGSRVTSSRHALGAEGVGATRPSAHMCAPGRARCLLGMVGIDDVVHCALLESSGGRSSSSHLRARAGWHTARASVPPLPHSSGAPVLWLMARGRREQRRRRPGLAPPARQSCVSFVSPIQGSRRTV
jgi:hypothetical protein